MADERNDILRGHPEDAFIRRLDPDYIELVRDVADVKSKMLEIQTSQHRQERYLVGGWNEQGEWVQGVRDEIISVSGSLQKCVDEMTKTKTSYLALSAGVWSIFLLTLGYIVKSEIIPTIVQVHK